MKFPDAHRIGAERRRIYLGIHFSEIIRGAGWRRGAIECRWQHAAEAAVDCGQVKEHHPCSRITGEHFVALQGSHARADKKIVVAVIELIRGQIVAIRPYAQLRIIMKDGVAAVKVIDEV